MDNSDYDEVNRRAAMLQMSPTLSRAAALAQDAPFNVTDNEERRSVVTTCLVDVATSIDKGEITFSTVEARAMTIGLLTVALMIVFDGNVPVEQVSAH